MKLKNLTIIVLILTLGGSAAAQMQMTLEKAIETGLKNNFDIRIARNDYEIAENNVGKGTAGFMPKLDVSGSQTYTDTKTRTNSPFSFGDSEARNLSGSIALNWTLFDGFRMFTSNRQYRTLRDLGEYQARSVIENSMLGILRAYFNLVQQNQLLAVSKKSMEISEAQLKKEEVKRELGSLSSTDFLNAQVSFNNDRADFMRQELQVLLAQKNLNILLGQDPETELLVSEEIRFIGLEMDYEAILQLAQQKNSALLASQKNYEAAEQSVGLRESVFYPRLALNGTYSKSDATTESATRGEITSETDNTVLGLSLSYNLFNGFQDKIDYQNAKLDTRNKQIRLEKARRELEGLVREKYDTFLKQKEILELETLNVQAAQQNLQVQQDRYKIGAITYIELRSAQINLIRAQTAMINARFNARITRLEIDQLTGQMEVW